MKIQVLGSGSSGNAYLIQDGRTTILLDAGLPYKELEQKTRYRLTHIGGCLITHEHGDHSKAVEKMLSHGINCYMSPGTANALRIKPDQPFHHCVYSNKIIDIEEAQVLPFNVVHDAAEPLGFYISLHGNHILYLTDSAYSPYRFKNMTHILIECNYDGDIIDKSVKSGDIRSSLRKRIQETHFSLENVKEFMKANDLSKVKEIYLCHLSNANSDEDKFKSAIQEITGKPVYIAG